MKKIIHLSDLHVGYDKQDLTGRLKIVVSNIISRCNPSNEYIVLITGDLVNDANNPDSYKDAEFCLDKLRNAGFCVLLMPGNHDYGTGSWGNKKFVKLFKEFFFGTSELVYPKLDIIEDVAFIGIDSMAEELHWYDKLFAEGEIGKEQLSRLKKILNHEVVKTCRKRVVYMHHHPFDPYPLHELKDSSDLKEVLINSSCIDALLYGHNHEGLKHEAWGIPRCYDGGSSTRKKDMPSIHRIIDLSKNPDEDIEADFLK